MPMFLRPSPAQLPRRFGRFSPSGLTFFLNLVLLGATLTACGGRRGRARITVVAPATERAEAQRDAWQRPALLVAKMGLTPGMSVADIGAGSGYMLPYLSRAVGAKGRVYAVELDEKLIAALRRRVKKARLRNVVVITGAVEDLPLSTPVDRMLLLNTYPEMEQPVAMLRAMSAHLKPTGQLVIVDYKADEKVAGPPVEQRLSLETITAEARGAGFVESTNYDVLPRQYIALFTNPSPEAIDPSGEDDKVVPDAD